MNQNDHMKIKFYSFAIPNSIKQQKKKKTDKLAFI